MIMCYNKKERFDMTVRKNNGVNLMSEKIQKYVPCPKCMQQSSVELTCSVNTENDPDIRKVIMDETFFRWKCKKCGFQKNLLHPLLYNDVKNQFMVYYIPKVERRQISDEKLEQEFADLPYIKRRVVPDINSMKEKIVLFENNIDDMAVEITKSAVSEVVAKSTSKSVHSGYFMDMDKDKNSMTFQYFIGGSRQPYIQTIRLEVYHRSVGIVKKYFPKENKKAGFLNIDSFWAKEALRKYKNSSY